MTDELDRAAAAQLPEEFLAMRGLPADERLRMIVDWHWDHQPVDRREALIVQLAPMFAPLLDHGAEITPALRNRCVETVLQWIEPA